MDRKKKFLSDILNAIELIELFTKDVNSYSAYVDDLKTKSAVERQLVIIGEAVSTLHKENNSEFEFARQLIAFRNRVVHAYDSIDDAIVWSIIKKHLPQLKTKVQNKLN